MGYVALAERPRQFFSSDDVWPPWFLFQTTFGMAGLVFLSDDVWRSPAWPGCSPCQEGPRMAQILRVWLVIEQLICELERGRATWEPNVV